MGRLDWLTERPFAHRGLHEKAAGVVENTPSAVARAVQHGFGIEIDVRPTADGEAVVFHDATLDRLTEATGPVSAVRLSELRSIRLRATTDRLWTLDECLDLVGGRVPLIVEIKSSWSGDMSHARRVAARLAQRNGAIAASSFDPRVVRELRAHAPRLPRGIIGESCRDGDREWSTLSRTLRLGARNLLHWPATSPDFVCWKIADLPTPAVSLARRAGRPVIAWTVRTVEDQGRAALHADQMIFEGFLPR